MKTTFEEIEQKYAQAMECMAFNEKAALDESSNPSHATWIHQPTLARWLYGSSQEFLKDYLEVRSRFDGYMPQGQSELILLRHHEDLLVNLSLFRNRLRAKFPEDKLIMEVTA